MENPKKMVTIAGSDILAGGGIQADLATFNEYGYFGLSVITSIVTVTKDDFTIHPVPLDVLDAQLQSIFALDEIAGVKVGLLPTVGHVHMVADYLRRYATNMPVIIDPVMAFKETDDVDVVELVAAFQKDLLPLASMTTPNLVEGELLAGIKIKDKADLAQAAEIIRGFGADAVVVKGGARLAGNEATDVVTTGAEPTFLGSQKLDSAFNNGAGCTFASAIASQLATGKTPVDAVKDAKDFVYWGIKNGVALNDDFSVGNVWQAARRLRGK